MQQPDLNKTWRTWIKIAPNRSCTFEIVQNTIRNEMQRINQQKEITWFYFLIKPNPADPDNVYFEVIFATDGTDPKKFLPVDFIADNNPHDMTSIFDIDLKLLKDEDIREAWKLIGKQSEFIIDLVCAHKENIEITPKQISQFMHYFMNPMGYEFNSLFFPKAHNIIIDEMMRPIPHPIFNQMLKLFGGELILF